MAIIPVIFLKHAPVTQRMTSFVTACLIEELNSRYFSKQA